MQLVSIEDLTPQVSVTVTPAHFAAGPGFEATYLPDIDDYLARFESLVDRLQIPELTDPPPIKERKIGKFVYIPVEVKGRELATRAQLAGELAKAGFQVVLGMAGGMAKYKYGDMPPGIVLFKTMNRLDARMIFQAAHSGHFTVCLNEELPVMAYDETIYRANINPAAAKLIDFALVPDETAAGLLRKIIEPKKIKVSGSARLSEWLGPTKDGEILVCGMAGTINNDIGFENYIAMVFGVMGSCTGDIYQIQKDQIIHERAYYETVLESAKKLRDRFGSRVRFRPHPTEKITNYDAAGILIDNYGSFSERLKNAAVVVHVSGCGTGIEATMAGIPTVRIGTGGCGRSRDTGWVVNNAEDCVTAVEALLQNPRTIGANGEELVKTTTPPLTIAPILSSLWQANRYRMPFGVVKAWKQRFSEYAPEPLQAAKFPPTTDGEVAELAAHPVERLDHNVWALMPSM